MKNINPKIELILKTLPKSAGVYLMKNLEGEVIYVGKAIDLSKRVKSYFKRELSDIKTIRLVEKIVDIEWMVTDTELEALMLETTLIKKFRPKYNILMKDDKSYVYLKITDDEFPRVIVVRRVVKDKGKYFGPYTNGLRVNKILRSLNRIFPFYTYQNKSGVAPMDSVAGRELFQKRSQSAWGDLTDREVYLKMIDDLVLFLKGKTGGVVKIFRDAMQRAVLEKKFEQAAILRDRIGDVAMIVEGQKVVSAKKIDVDVIGYFGEENKWIISVLVVREGKIIDIRNMEAVSKISDDAEEIINRFVVEYYLQTSDYPKIVYLPVQFDREQLLVEYMNLELGQKMKFEFPKIGYKKQIMEMANKNAKMEYLRQRSFIKFARNEGLGIVDLLEKVQETKWQEYSWQEKELKRKIFRIEGYDISNLGDTGVVGAMVAWELKANSKLQKENNEKIKQDNSKLISQIDDSGLAKMDLEEMKKWQGGFNKNLYKRFEIKSFEGQDDFGAMKEVFERRFAKAKKDDAKWIYPDLVLVDGGKGQLGVALQVLKSLNVDVPVISLAKREEEIWMGRIDGVTGEIEYQMMEMEKTRLANLLMQSIRNEVHRFAVSYQRIVRKKDVRKSVLDSIDGLGPKKKKLLLTEFGSVQGLLDAGEMEVEKVVGKKLAREIFELI